MNDWNPSLEGVAIVGMAGRFPGAPSVPKFWANQLQGLEAISHFRVEELEVANGAELSADTNYVRSRSILEEVDLFDAEFFGIYPREAELMDPQQRLFLEACWQALEDAAYDPATYAGPIGVFAGSSTSTYFLSRLCARNGFMQRYTGNYQVGNYLEMMGNNPDFLATRVSYKLNLRGPSFTIAAGCSTSLLAVTQACQSLLTYQCDMALAGGSSITFPQKRGSFYQDGGMISPDGHCRAFDANAQGTVFGSGVAVVLLKRLDDAVREKDQIYAVIRGFAANNDGSAKVGYTAPSVEGQARVITLAQQAAGINPETIGYIEAHGTATPLGDPIELAALNKAFRAHTDKNNFCALGTAKANVGHLDIAAGVTGLIHAAHVVRDGVFPPMLHFSSPNPKFDLASSPFYVNRERCDWKHSDQPRRAGVSAFGVGGTNAHVVLEQAPHLSTAPSTRPTQLLVVSARTPAALENATDNLAQHLTAYPELNLEDVAWTLQAGRRAFQCRRIVVAKDTNEALVALRKLDRKHTQSRLRPTDKPEVYFLFPGQGSQHPNMGREIYESESVFRDAVDRCSEVLRARLGADLRTLLYPAEKASDATKDLVTSTIVAQPAIFTIEYALAQLWMSWGIRPAAMLGHSIGEFVAACLAGVFSLEDALSLVAARGEMMQKLPAGGMLSVRLPEADVRARLNGHLSIAAVNAPSLCVVSGPIEALEHFEQQLTKEGIAFRRLVTSHAFHSSMMDPIVEPFTARAAQVRMGSPCIPYVSGVTGKWITDAEAGSPDYWARHFRQPVKFSEGISTLLKMSDAVLVEVGPGNVLSTLARQHIQLDSTQTIAPSLSDGFLGGGDSQALMNALGAVWMAGITPNWSALYKLGRRRVSLPTYPFERKRYWLENSDLVADAPATVDVNTPKQTSRASAIEGGFAEEAHPVNATSDRTVATAAPNSNRAARILKILAEIFEDLSGMDLSQVDSSASFLAMGFDSLFLTQVTQALHSKLGLKITFRQLLGEQSSMRSLAEYIDDNLPADALDVPVELTIVPAPQSLSASALTSAQGLSDAGNPASVAANSSMERLLHEQLQAMNRLFAMQIETLRATSPAVSAEVASSKLPNVNTGTPSSQPHISRSAEKDSRELKGYTPFKALQNGSASDLTDRQGAYIAALVGRYTQKTAGSKTKTQEYRQVLADPRVVAGFRSEWKEMVYPIITVRSEGSHLWDVDGNEYVDILNGFGPIMLGHRPDYVERAIEKQLREGFEIGPQTLLAGEVAKMICEFTGNERATFCNTGSEAVVAAMRLARTVTGRSKVVFFAGDYHGMFDEVLVKGFMKGGTPHSIPVAPGIPREKAANVVVLEYGAPESLEWIRKNAKDLAAVLVEPVQSRHPNLQPIEFLKEIRKITDQSETCLIFDEVVTGFRVHPGGCQALFEIRADLATYGKVLAGGMPIGVLAGKARYMDALDGGSWQFGDDSYPSVGVTFFAGTFVRHPLALAAAKAVLEHFKRQGPALQRDLTVRTGALVRRLNEILAKSGVPAHIENFASIFYFSFPTDFRFGSLFYYHLREKGIHLLEGFPCFLTTQHSDADLERIVRAFEETAAEMRAGGALPEGAVDAAAVSQSMPATFDPLLQAHMTEPQREIFLAAKFGDDASCSFNESFSIHLRGALQVDALSSAINALVGRHDALRATVDPDGMDLRFEPKLKLNIPLQDISAVALSERQAELKLILAEDAATPFDLVAGPLVRAKIIRLEPQYHVLVFTSHHIVCDGWSTNVLLDELPRIYKAYVRGTELDLAPSPSFAKYAVAQLAANASSETAEVESYWIDQFKDLPNLLDLPVDRPRPAVREYSGATFRAQIDAEAYRQIKQMSSRKGCTLFTTLVAGFQALLHRLSNQNDIVVGIPTAGQSLLDDSNLVGHCVNFLPLRTRFREGQTFGTLLGEVKKTLLDAYDHQSYTYGTLARKLAIPRSPSRLPLMEVQFNLERIGSAGGFDGLTASVDPNPKAAVNFDLFFNIVESEKGLTIDCDYNTGLFDSETIARWLSHYRTLLLDAVRDPDASVDDLSLLTPEDLSSIMRALNPNSTDISVRSTIHQVFEDRAANSPDATAVTIGEESITYRTLNERANKLARLLRSKGVKSDALVAVCFERSIELIVALLGILKAGGAYVPIDSSYPKERLTMMLDDARPRVLLTQERILPLLPNHSAESICLDRDLSVINLESSSNLEPISGPENLAYVMYTSGSTGKPKGVMVTHTNVIRLFQATDEWFHFSQSDVWTLFHSYAFDFSVWEIWGPLTTGGRLVIVPYWITRSPQDFYNLLAAEGVTILNQTPAAFYQVIQVEESGYTKPLGLRYVIFGGEALNFSNLRPWIKRHGDAVPRLVNMYGITETTVHVTYRPLTTVDVESETRSLIGVPVPDLGLYLLDGKQRSVPRGVVGEIYVGGGGVARGYLNRPDLTTDRFIANPFTGGSWPRLYKSGDLARLLNDGELEYLGRVDSQVKIHGFRVELGEIETALGEHPSVNHCAVTAGKIGPGEKKLVAYVLVKDAAKFNSVDLRGFLEKKLPAHMIPYAYVQIDFLPLNVNGKVDWAKLPVPEVGSPSPSRQHVAPRTPAEKILADILSEVLRVEHVGVTDNLFELGADSLHVFQITSRAAKAGLTISPRLLLQQRTIAGVVAEIENSEVSSASQTPAIRPVARQKYRKGQEVQQLETKG